MGKKNIKKGNSEGKAGGNGASEEKKERVSAIGRYMKQMGSDEKPKNDKKSKKYC